MARFKFRVTVPFGSRVSEGIGSTSLSQLGPEVSQVGDISIEQGEEFRIAVVEVEGDTLDAAEEEGVAKVGQLLRLLAVGNHAFTIRLSKVRASSLGSLEHSRGIPSAGSTVGAEEAPFLIEHVGVILTIKNTTFEDHALKTVHNWPVHVRRALDLNYAAVLAHERDIRFLLSAAALDVLTWGTLGQPQPLLKTRLGKTQYDTFRDELNNLLTTHGLAPSDVSRLAEHTLHTHDESAVDRIARYLTLRGIQPALTEIRGWWAVRGTLAHGASVNEESLKGHLGNVQSTVRRALRNELDLIGEKTPL